MFVGHTSTPSHLFFFRVSLHLCHPSSLRNRGVVIKSIVLVSFTPGAILSLAQYAPTPLWDGHPRLRAVSSPPFEISIS